MLNLYQGLHLVGSPTTEILISSLDKGDWAVCSVAKDWWQRVKPGRVDKTDPEFYAARRNNHLYVNWVDVTESKFFRPEEMDLIFDFLDEMLHHGKKILVHCDQNKSRSPSVVMMYLASIGILSRKYTEAVSAFCVMYPTYDPKIGIQEFVRQHWPDYVTL